MIASSLHVSRVHVSAQDFLDAKSFMKPASASHPSTGMAL
jgi:hypothetical protein